MFARTFRSLFGRIFGFSLTSAASLLVLMIASSAESKGIQPKDSFGQIPIAFEKNQGQVSDKVDYLARGAGYTLFLQPDQMTLSMVKGQGNHGFVRVSLAGANAKAKASSEKALPWKSNYIVGNDAKEWRTNISNYERVRYSSVYPGIDLVYYGRSGHIEHDFIVAPHADASAITLGFEGTKGIVLDKSGDLLLNLAQGQVAFKKPFAYQVTPKGDMPVAVKYAMKGGSVGFALGAYDSGLPLVIDPVLVYSTFVGGSGSDQALSLAVDGAGSLYVTGQTDSTNFPGVSGKYDASGNGGTDIFVFKMNASGTSLSYATYVGGSGNESGFSIAVDKSGYAYVAGSTSSSNFPTHSTTPRPIQSTFGGNFDMIVLRLSPNGTTLAYSTYLGGSANDQALAVALASNGLAVIAGYSGSATTPSTPRAYDSSPNGGNDVYVAQINQTGSALVFGTLLGGSADDRPTAITLDSDNNIYLTGQTTSSNFPVVSAYDISHNSPGAYDAFVAKFNADGSSLAYSTLVGGSGLELGRSITLDTQRRAWVVGSTASPNFPISANAFQPTPGGAMEGFALLLSANGSSLEYSTFLGGSGADTARAGKLDELGILHVVGDTASNNFPQSSAMAPYAQGNDVFVLGLSPSLGLIYSSYLGGAGNDFGRALHANLDGSVIVVGDTTSNGSATSAAGSFPTTTKALSRTNSGGSDTFVAKYKMGLAEAADIAEGLCPCDDPWKNHGKYVVCVEREAKGLARLQIISEKEKGVLVSAAGQSECGHK